MHKFQTMYSFKIKKGEIVKCDGIQFATGDDKCNRRIKGPSTMFMIVPHARSDVSIDRILCKKCAAKDNPKFVSKALENES